MKFHTHSLSVLLLLSALPMNAETTAPDHHDDPINLGDLIVSAAPLGSSQVDLAQASTVLSGLRLETTRKATLGETLSSEPGMSSTYFGPGASRPIIRGQGGDRLKLLENGSGTLDASNVSPDHAVSIEPFLVKRIEIVRGPAALLYGSSAVGGVVNILTHRIDDEAPSKAADTELMLSFDSAANSWNRGGSTNISVLKTPDQTGVLVLHLDGFRRDAGDLRIPGDAEIETATSTGELKTEPTGVLPNSALMADGAAVGLSFIGKDYHIGASYSGYNTTYGVPGTQEESATAAATSAGGVHIDLHQRRIDIQGEIQREMGLLTGARFKFGHADYAHAEIEADGALGTRFTNLGHDARMELTHSGADGHLAGAVGLQAGRSQFEAVGAEAFVPSSLTLNDALFAFEEYTQGHLTIQAGARLEKQRIEAPSIDANRRDTLAGASSGLIWKLGQGWSLTANLSHSSRAPNAQELYANGPHAGTNSYEIGDPSLLHESVTHYELGVRGRTRLLTSELSVFEQDFSHHIHDVRTGMVAVDGPEGTLFVPESDPSAPGGLPVYQQTQTRARFTGVELDTRWHLHSGEKHSLDLRVAADLVRARTDTAPLPRIPAARTTLGLEWRKGLWTAGVDWQHGFAQNQVALNEKVSPSYELAGASLTRCVQLAGLEADLFVRASNLLDKEIRPHTSYLRDLAPLPGRALATGVTLRF